MKKTSLASHEFSPIHLQGLRPSKVLLSAIILGAGIGLGLYGFNRRDEGIGSVALGAGGSMVAAALVIVLNELL